jgi:MFS transporter, DHA2 family, multidrug resistance protein
MDITPERSDQNRVSKIANIAALSIGTSAIVLDGGIAAVTLPTIAKTLGISDAASVVVITGYQLILVSTILPFASLADRVGFHKLYRYGQSVFFTATLLLLFVDNLTGLVLVRLLQALGGAAALSVTAAIVRNLYPPDQLGRGLAINSILISIAAAVAPTVGGFVLTYLPWQASFAVAAPLIGLSLLLGSKMPKADAANARFDVKAALLCTASIACIIGGIELGVHGKAFGAGIALTLTGLVVGFALFRHEKGNSRPVLPIDLLANPFFSRAFAASVVTFMASMIFTIYLPFWLGRVQERDVTEIGLLLAVWPLTMMVVSPLSGVLSDKVTPGKLGSLGMAVFVAAIMLISVTPPSASFAQLGWRLALGGIGLAMFLAPNSRLIVSVAPQSRAASAGSMVSTARLFGQALGATLVAAILSRAAPGSNWPFMAAALLGVISLALCAIQLRHAAADDRSGAMAI